jgi:hypothetical protein
LIGQREDFLRFFLAKWRARLAKYQSSELMKKESGLPEGPGQRALPWPGANPQGKEGGMSKKTKKKEADERCQRMLAEALPSLAKGKSVRFEDVRSVYEQAGISEKTLRSRFASDLERLVRNREAFNRIIAPLGYVLPEFAVRGGELLVAVRPFSSRLWSYGQENAKQKLARLLVKDVFNNLPLVPRFGSLFLGYGTTLYFVAQEILARQRDFSEELSVSTPNFEVATLFYFCVPQFARQTSNRLMLPGCTVNWNTGSMLHGGGNLECGTAIAGCDTLTKSGELFTDNHDEVAITNAAMAAAKERVIIVGNHDKITRGGCVAQLTVPAPADHKEIFFVTDRPLPKGYKVPPGTTLVVLEPG